MDFTWGLNEKPVVLVGGTNSGMVVMTHRNESRMWVPLYADLNLEAFHGAGIDEVVPELRLNFEEYTLHTFRVGGDSLFEIGVVKGKDIFWAFTELLRTFVAHHNQEGPNG